MLANTVSDPPVAADSPGLSPQHLPAMLQLRFQDADEQAQALNGWNQNYLQLSAGQFQGALCQVQGTGARLFVEQVQQSVRQTGLLGSGVLALGIPLFTNGTGMFCGAPCADDVLHVFSGASGFEFRPPRQHTMLGIELQLGVTGATGPHIDGSLDRVLPQQAGTLHLPGRVLAGLRSYLLELLRSAHADPELLSNTAVVATVADFLLDQMTPAAGADRHTGGLATRWTIVRQACARVDATLDAPPTVAQLCLELGVSRRTLQSGFQHLLGVSPLTYLKAARLQQARRALKQVGSVTEAATRSGFWHFGHFAHDYQALFGEKPSDTLHRYRSR